MLVVWRPDLKKYTAYVTHEVPASVPATGGLMDLDLPKVATQALGAALAAWQKDLHVSSHTSVIQGSALECNRPPAGHCCQPSSDGIR